MSGESNSSVSHTSDEDMSEEDSDDTVCEDEVTVASVADQLRKALLHADNAKVECEMVPEATRRMVVDCFSLGVSNNGDRMTSIHASRLQKDKETLLVQVDVLSERLEAQTAKVRPLAEKVKLLEAQFAKGCEENDRLKASLLQETQKRSTLQLQTRDMMSELNSLRRQTSTSSRSATVAGRMNRHLSDSELVGVREAHILLLQEEVDRMSKEKTAVDAENSSLKEQVAHLEQCLFNQEKKITELKGTVQKYKRVQDMVRSASLSVGRRPGDSCALMSPFSSPSEQFVFSPDYISGDGRIRRASFEEEGSQERVKGRREQGFSKGKFMPQFGRVSGRSSSEPNLVGTDDFIQLSSQEMQAREARSCSFAEHPDISRGTSTGKRLKRSASAIKGSIGRAFGRLRRHASFSTVQSTEEGVLVGENRPGWTVARSLELSNRDHPMCEWECDAVCQWLRDIGLEMYVGNCKHNKINGLSFLSMADGDFEQIFVLKHPLHRKKLKLALQNVSFEEPENLSLLDHEWVGAWLEEVGLPQYKHSFMDARVDGHVLNVLTLDDLGHLKVVNDFHAVSLKRAIQCLRRHNFSRSYLVGPVSEDVSSPEREYRFSEVTVWSNARVRQWLECIEMSEYAGNLKESGVHGALFTLEPRFNVDTLAATLQVKELIRRHLSQHFSRLVGAACLATKREAEQTKSYVRLEPQTKRFRRRLLSIGSMRSRQKMELEWKQMYVCPLDLDMPTAAVTGRVAKEDEDYDSDLRTGMQHAGGERREPRNMNGNGTGFSDRNSFGPPQAKSSDIEAMSREMDSLTEMINKELAKKATPSPFT